MSSLTRKEQLELFRARKKLESASTSNMSAGSKPTSNSSLKQSAKKSINVIDKQNDQENINPNVVLKKSDIASTTKSSRQDSFRTKVINRGQVDALMQSKLKEAKSIYNLCGIEVTRQFLEAILVDANLDHIRKESIFWLTWLKLEETSNQLPYMKTLLSIALDSVHDIAGRAALTAYRDSKPEMFNTSESIISTSKVENSTVSTGTNVTNMSYNLRPRNTPIRDSQAGVNLNKTNYLSSYLGYDSDSDTDDVIITNDKIQIKRYTPGRCFNNNKMTIDKVEFQNDEIRHIKDTHTPVPNMKKKASFMSPTLEPTFQNLSLNPERIKIINNSAQSKATVSTLSSTSSHMTLCQDISADMNQPVLLPSAAAVVTVPQLSKKNINIDTSISSILTRKRTRVQFNLDSNTSTTTTTTTSGNNGSSIGISESITHTPTTKRISIRKRKGTPRHPTGPTFKKAICIDDEKSAYENTGNSFKNGEMNKTDNDEYDRMVYRNDNNTMMPSP